MYKKLLLIIIVVFTMCIYTNTYATDYTSYKNRSLCGTFEVANATSDGKLTKVACYSNYNDARNKMESVNGEGTVVLTKIGSITRIIDANYALIDLSYNSETLSYVYEKNSLTSRKYTYINTLDTSMAIDAAFMDTVYSSSKTYAVKVRFAGITGWMRIADVEILPLPWVKAASSYTVTSSTIKHNYVNRPSKAYTGTAGRVLGPKPTMLSAATYYSYDGHYFYKTLKNMLTDYRNNTYNNSVNKSNPYYNYYMYLSNHTKTTYSSINIDEYIRNNLGYTKDVYGFSASSNTSRLYGSGTFFYNSQQVYGANAILSLSLSRNETANGTSSLAIRKNNGFGLNAVDSNPYQAANWYATYPYSITGFARDWITYRYAKATHSLYFGPQYGNKAIGMNVKYASDIYWSEKMASNYYYFDKAYGLQDYNYYQLGIINTPCYAYKASNTTSTKIYQYPEKEDAVVIVGEVTGTSVNGNTKWYKVVSDLNLNSNYKEKTSGAYNWNIYVYVPAAYINKINTPKNGYKTPNSVISYNDANYTYDLQISNSEFKPKVGQSIRNTTYYYDSTLSKSIGKTLLKDKYIMVHAIAYNGNSPVSYLVTSDYMYDQKHWVKASDIKFVSKAYGKESISTSTNAYSWVNSTTQDTASTKISGLYDGCYFPILETKTVSGVVWYKVPVSLTSNTNSYGWTLSTATNVKITKFNYVAANNKPTLTVNNITLTQYQKYNLLNYVTATDSEDGNITNNVTVTTNLNINVIGTYTATFSITDSSNETTTKTVTITVVKDEAPVITVSKIELELNKEYNLLSYVKATDKEDGNITSKVTVSSNLLDITTEGTYKVTYSVTDSANNTTTKEVDVYVLKDIEKIVAEGKILEDGVYKIASSLDTNKVLDVIGASKSNLANIDLYQSNNTLAQRFIITYVKDGYYEIENVLSTKELDVYGAGTKNGTNVDQYTRNGSNAQLWKIYKTTDGYYKFKPKCNLNLSLELKNGNTSNKTNIQVGTSNGSLGQAFVLTLDKTYTGYKTISNGNYNIYSALNNNKVLDVAGSSKKDKANVQLYTKDGTSAQKFNVSYYGKGYYIIKNNNSNKVIEVAGAKTANKSNVDQYTRNNTCAQLWVIKKVGNYYTLMNRCSNKVLDIAGAKTTNGTNIQIYSSNGTNGQKFGFKKY